MSDDNDQVESKITIFGPAGGEIEVHELKGGFVNFEPDLLFNHPSKEVQPFLGSGNLLLDRINNQMKSTADMSEQKRNTIIAKLVDGLPTQWQFSTGHAIRHNKAAFTARESNVRLLVLANADDTFQGWIKHGNTVVWRTEGYECPFQLAEQMREPFDKLKGAIEFCRDHQQGDQVAGRLQKVA